jgi:hypothetical protein
MYFSGYKNHLYDGSKHPFLPHSLHRSCIPDAEGHPFHHHVPWSQPGCATAAELGKPHNLIGKRLQNNSRRAVARTQTSNRAIHISLGCFLARRPELSNRVGGGDFED